MVAATRTNASKEDTSVLTFEEVRWTTPDGREVLGGVSGIVVGGTVTAILGASGAGKTTLLQTLGGQHVPTSGTVLFNGAPISSASKRYIGLVPQEDVILPTVTVEEAISFSAALRVSKVSHEERANRVAQIMADLSLLPIKNSRVGDTRRRKGISGGERKRTSIGVEMVHRPRLLLLDEPTSGLDSSSAHSLLLLLKKLAKERNVAVVFTVHQPSSRDWALFDRVLVLDAGHTAYSGLTSDCLGHFERLGRPCPPLTNPAEFIVEVVSDGFCDQEGDGGRGVQRGALTAAFDTSPAAKTLHAEIRKHVLLETATIKPAVERGEIFATTFYEQFRVLFRRAWNNSRRSPVANHAAMGRSLTMGLLVGVLFRSVGLGQASVQDRTGALYFVLTSQIFSSQASMRVFLEERDLFFRERLSGAYRTSAYFWAKSLADTPNQVMFAMMFSMIMYFMVGLQLSVGHLFVFCLSVVLTTLAAESYVVMVGAAVPDDRTAAVLGPIAFALMSLFGGFFLNIESLPWYVSWLQYTSLFRFSFQALMQNEFRGLNFTCSEADAHKWVERLDESTRAHVEEFIHLLPCPVPNGETHLERLKLDTIDMWTALGWLLFYFVAFRALAFAALRWRTSKMLQGEGRGAIQPKAKPDGAKLKGQ